jgi:hypothetical protein
MSGTGKNKCDTIAFSGKRALGLDLGVDSGSLQKTRQTQQSQSGFQSQSPPAIVNISWPSLPIYAETV